MKFVLLITSWLFSSFAMASVGDHLPRVTQAIANDKVITGVLTAFASNHVPPLECPTIAAGSVVVEVATADVSPFHIDLVCLDRQDARSFSAEFKGSITWIGGDIQIPIVEMNGVEIASP